jgi:hypothetical protein
MIPESTSNAPSRIPRLIASREPIPAQSIAVVGNAYAQPRA